MNSTPDFNDPGRREEVGADQDFAQLIERIHDDLRPSLERIAWAILRDRALASDAVQEAFELLTRRAADTDLQYVKGWLIKTVQFQAQNIRRKQSRSLVGSEIVTKSLDRLVRTEAGSVQGREVEYSQQIELAIGRLPPEQVEVVTRRLRGEESFASIAKSLNVPLGTVLSRMRLALKKLRAELSPIWEAREERE